MADAPKEKEKESPKTDAGASVKKADKSNLMPMIIMAAAAFVFAIGGYVVAKMMFKGPAAASAQTAGAEPEEKEAKAEPEKKASGGHGGAKTEKKASGGHGGGKKEGSEKSVQFSQDGCWLFELEPVVANLDEPGVTRYARASLIIELSPNLPDSTGLPILEENKAILRNWLTIYLAGCTLDDIRGRKNLMRIQSEIKDAYNDQLFKNSKPMITRVLFKEFQIQ